MFFVLFRIELQILANAIEQRVQIIESIHPIDLITRMCYKYYPLNTIIPRHFIGRQIISCMPLLANLFKHYGKIARRNYIYISVINRSHISPRMYHFCNLFLFLFSYSRFFEILNRSQILTPSRRNLVYIVVVLFKNIYFIDCFIMNLLVISIILSTRKYIFKLGRNTT